eukprot:TRINITY_DN5770_c0_g1_i2.p1 TRINITY_DN5770_c0_g1~~TRINITY_DN5770_c0_g1_i2.p1  ORF type:complete len:534 (+),score=77.14 TRINITY_DN5770_c0_g1_i2:1208-2809(+)
MKFIIVTGCLATVTSQWMKIAKNRKLRVPECELRLREANRAQKREKDKRAVTLFVEGILSRSQACVQSEERAMITRQKKMPQRLCAAMSSVTAACNIVVVAFRSFHTKYSCVAAVLGIACTVTEPGELLLSQHLRISNTECKAVRAKRIARSLHTAMREGVYPMLVTALKQIRDEQEWVEVQSYWESESGDSSHYGKYFDTNQDIGATQGNSLLHQQLSLMKLEDICSNMMAEKGIWYHVTIHTLNKYSFMRKRPWMPSSRTPLPAPMPKALRVKQRNPHLKDAGNYPNLRSTKKVLLDSESEFLRSLYQNAPIEEPSAEHVFNSKRAGQRAAAVLAGEQQQLFGASGRGRVPKADIQNTSISSTLLLNSSSSSQNNNVLNPKQFVRKRNRITARKNYFTARNFGESMTLTSASFSTTCHRLRCNLCQGGIVKEEYQHRCALLSSEESQRDTINNYLLSSLVLVMWNVGGLPATRTIRNFLIPALIANEQQHRVALQALRLEQLHTIQKSLTSETSHLMARPPVVGQYALQVI